MTNWTSSGVFSEKPSEQQSASEVDRISQVEMTFVATKAFEERYACKTRE
jgi:hypothetical protein